MESLVYGGFLSWQNLVCSATSELAELVWNSWFF